MASGLDTVTAENKGTGLVYVGYWTSPQSVPRREINTHGRDPCRAWLPRLRYPTPGTSCCIYWKRCPMPVPLSDKWLQAYLWLYYNAGTGIAYWVQWLSSGLLYPARQIVLFSETSRPSLKPIQFPIHWMPLVFSRGQSGRDVKVITSLHLLPKLRMGGVIPSTVPVCFSGVHGDFTFTRQQ